MCARNSTRLVIALVYGAHGLAHSVRTARALGVDRQRELGEPRGELVRARDQAPLEPTQSLP